MRTLIVSLLLTLLVGCSTINARIETWHGSSIEHFIAANGTPSTVVQTGSQFHYGWNVGDCYMTITTNLQGTITSGRARGIC